ncbi:MAG: protoheme IX farnesyltransferase [Gammaproteobacteria bacterium]|nr:protoheme IX farnesyltransferase [Gammaproteobacteria bacterium]
MGNTAHKPSWRSYYELTKPRVVALIVFTAIIGMFLATDVHSAPFPHWQALVFGSLGIWFAAASAAVVNQVLDQRIDAEMNRTRHRPLVTDQLSDKHALVFALVLGVLSMLMLYLWVNPLTALLTFFSLLGYAIIYTAYLKRATPQNIVIGGAAGAAPPLLGWVAVTGEVHAVAIILFLIIFTWTPPHFWALAIHRREEYAKVNIPMLPVTHGVAFTNLHIMFYTILLILVTLLPYLIGFSGWLYLLGAIGLGGRYLYYAIAIRDEAREDIPMKSFWFSINYLMLIFVFLIVDHYLPLVSQAFA